MNSAVSKNEITLYFYPSPGLSWKSPSSLAITTAVNKLSARSRGIGHVSVRIRSVEGEPIHVFTGMTQIHKHEGRNEVIFKGYGLGILLHDFRGMLETPEKLEPELVDRAHSGKLSYLRLETTRAAIERARDFIAEFRARGADAHYGMPHRPRYAEGGGCSAFAASILEVAGLLDPEFERAWTRRHLLPLSHIGGPRTGRFVGIHNMVTRLNWADPSEPHEELFAWDPDLMHSWLTRKSMEISSGREGRFRLEKWKNAQGLVMSAHHVPVPTGALFHGEPGELFRSITYKR